MDNRKVDGAEGALETQTDSSLDYAWRMYQEGSLSRAVVTALRKASAAAQPGPSTPPQISRQGGTSDYSPDPQPSAG